MLFGLRISLQAHHNDLQEWREACTDMLSDEGPGCAVPATESFEEVFGWRSVKAVLWPSADLGFRARQLWGRLSRSVRRASRVLRSLVWRDAHIHRDGLEQEHAWQVMRSPLHLGALRPPVPAIDHESICVLELSSTHAILRVAIGSYSPVS